VPRRRFLAWLRVVAAWCVAYAGFDFVAEEDPAASEFVGGEDVAAGVVEDGRRRHVEEVGDLVGVAAYANKRAERRGE
jgi:hypothetical protein